jgi:hypothetical protein
MFAAVRVWSRPGRALGTIVGLAVLTSGVFVCSAGASGVACGGCVGSYSGTWNAQVSYAHGVTAALSLGWTESLVPGSNGESAWELASVSNNSNVQFSDPGPPNTSCTASLSANPALAGNLGGVFGPQVTEGGSSIMIDPWPPTWWSSSPSTYPDPLVSTPVTENSECDNTSLETAYEDGFWTFSGNDCHPQISVPVAAKSTVQDDCIATGSGNEATGTGTLHSTLTIAICPNPSDNRLIAEAEVAAGELFHDDFQGSSVGHRHGVITGDRLAEYAILAIKAAAAAVKREFPLKTPEDRANRKRMMNKEARKLDDLLARVRQTALAKANAAEASFLARLVCPDADQKIRAVFGKLIAEIEDAYQADRRYIANEVVGATNLFCGCHLSRDERTAR